MKRLLKIFLESEKLVSGMSTVWEDTDGCPKQCMCYLAIYLMTLLSYSYDVIMDRAISSPGNGNNVFDGLNATDKPYFKGEMELMT